MPHIIIEYSNNLPTVNITNLIHDCHHALDGIHNVTIDRVKTRAIKLDDYLVGVHGEKGQMIHITFRLLTGRSVEARRELAQILYDKAKAHIPADIYPNAALTVEVVELERETYLA